MKCESCVYAETCDAFREANMVGANIDDCDSFGEYPGAYEDPDPFKEIFQVYGKKREGFSEEALKFAKEPSATL